LSWQTPSWRAGRMWWLAIGCRRRLTQRDGVGGHPVSDLHGAALSASTAMRAPCRDPISARRVVAARLFVLHRARAACDVRGAARHRQLRLGRPGAGGCAAIVRHRRLLEEGVDDRHGRGPQARPSCSSGGSRLCGGCACVRVPLRRAREGARAAARGESKAKGLGLCFDSLVMALGQASQAP
jgi:hypothetical protein